MTDEEAQAKLGSLCMPYAMRRLDELRKKGTKFAYYTSAFAALEIIKKTAYGFATQS